VHGIDSVTLAVIDTEGAETMVVNGSRHSLAQMTYLIVEVVDSFCRQAGSVEEELIRKFCALGFTAFVISRTGRLVPWQPGMLSDTVNMFLLTRKEYLRRTNLSS